MAPFVAMLHPAPAKLKRKGKSINGHPDITKQRVADARAVLSNALMGHARKIPIYGAFMSAPAFLLLGINQGHFAGIGQDGAGFRGSLSKAQRFC